MQREYEANTELAIGDLQRRLGILGFRLGDEANQGLYGEQTAAAVAAFKESTGLGKDEVLDQNTWTALKDASMLLGDRLLYLHIPNFRGRDVSELQSALSSMGFDNTVDTSFGPETELALRAFQSDMGLAPTGILDDVSLTALLRLKHVWDGKRGFSIAGRPATQVRSVQVLETEHVCVYGIDEPTRHIASRVANLARACTADTRFVSASALATAPKKEMLLVGLELHSPVSELGKPTEPQDLGSLRVHISQADWAIDSIAEAVERARATDNRLILVIDNQNDGSNDLAQQRQEMATLVLDALCLALAA